MDGVLFAQMTDSVGLFRRLRRMVRCEASPPTIEVSKSQYSRVVYVSQDRNVLPFGPL